MKALSSEWFQEHRGRMACWHHDDLSQIRHDLATMQHEIDQLEAELAAQHDTTPTAVTITATNQEGTPMTTYAPGATITFTAATVNAEQQPLATDTNGQPFTYTWTASAGTIVPGPDTTTITISDAPLGDVTATATDNAGFSGQTTATVADQTPAGVTVTAS